MLYSDLKQYKKEEKIKLQKQLKKEGYNLVLDKETTDDQIVSKVSTEVPNKATIDKNEKQSFEDFKTVYKGQIDEKCIAEYGNTDDKDLWEDCAKEMYLQTVTYIPEETDKPQGELVENKQIKIESPEPIFSEVKRNIENCTNCNQLFTYIGTLKEQLDEDFYNKLEEIIYDTEPIEYERQGSGDALTSYKQNLLNEIDDYIDELNLNEDKEIKIESVIDDYAKLQTQLNKEKQFNKQVEINSKLNEIISNNNLEFKDQSSGNANYDYKKVLSNGKNIGTIQISKNGKVSVYKTETIEYEKDYQTIFSEIDLKDIGSAVYDCIKENKLSEAAVQVILNKLKSSYNVKVED